MQVYGSASDADPVGPGDLLDIQVFGEPQMSGQVRVAANGAIRPAFLPSLPVAGKTPAEIEQQLRKSYSTLLRDPLVSVRLLENNSRRITITGAVPRPGIYAYSGQLRLMDALTLAGGVDPERASPDIFLLHPAKAEGNADPSVDTVMETIDTRKLIGDPGLNRLLEPGDVIDVPQQKRVYITGDVLHPGEMPLTSQLTLGKAITIAGGLLPQASHGTVKVLRRSSTSTGRTQLVANISDIQSNRRPDLPLEPGDIIVVPGSALRISGLEILDFLSGTGRWRVQQSILNTLP
jgi:polysaccharide export outer membrane protein